MSIFILNRINRLEMKSQNRVKSALSVTILRGWALTVREQLEEGLAQMRQALTDYRATGAALVLPYFLSLLAEGYGTLGWVDDGLHALQEGFEVIERTGECWWRAEVYRLQGALLLQQTTPDVAQAEGCLHQAIDTARSQHAKSLELRASVSLARLWQAQGKRQEAFDLLAPVYGWFTEEFDTADLKDAKALLETLQ
jgi:predicted ATPase